MFATQSVCCPVMFACRATTSFKALLQIYHPFPNVLHAQSRKNMTSYKDIAEALVPYTRCLSASALRLIVSRFHSYAKVADAESAAAIAQHNELQIEVECQKTQGFDSQTEVDRRYEVEKSGSALAEDSQRLSQIGASEKLGQLQVRREGSEKTSATAGARSGRANGEDDMGEASDGREVWYADGEQQALLDDNGDASDVESSRRCGQSRS